MNHHPFDVLMKAQQMAMKIMDLSRSTDKPDCHEIDLLAQDSQYILIETHGMNKNEILRCLEEGKQKLEGL